MIQGRLLCRDGSEGGVGRGAMVKGREETVQMWWGENETRSPKCPVGRGQTATLTWARVCPLVQSDSFLPGLSIKESREYNFSSLMGHCDLGPVGEMVLCGGRIPAASPLTSHGGALCKFLHLFGHQFPHLDQG